MYVVGADVGAGLAHARLMVGGERGEVRARLAPVELTASEEEGAE